MIMIVVLMIVIMIVAVLLVVVVVVVVVLLSVIVLVVWHGPLLYFERRMHSSKAPLLQRCSLLMLRREARHESSPSAPDQHLSL